jgi:hypothetical protein
LIRQATENIIIMPVKHIVMFTLKEDAPEEKVEGEMDDGMQLHYLKANGHHPSLATL